MSTFRGKASEGAAPHALGMRDWSIRSCTMHPPDPSEGRKWRSGDFYEVCRFILSGYNARPLEMAGAVGVEA